jgi:hypothetical protein
LIVSNSPSAGANQAGNRRRCQFAATIMVLVLAIADLAASQFALESRKVSIPENGSVPELVIRTAQLEVSLIPPPQWRLAIDTNATTLTWQTPDFHTMLRLRVVAGQGGGTAATKESLRKRVRADFPGAEIQDEAECYAATHSGTGFELEQRKARFPIVTRLAFVPFDGGQLELQLTCPLDESERARHRLTSVMNSLHIVPR